MKVSHCQPNKYSCNEKEPGNVDVLYIFSDTVPVVADVFGMTAGNGSSAVLLTKSRCILFKWDCGIIWSSPA